MRLLQFNNEISECIVLIKYMEGRFKANKNILAAVTGPTGSGKTYQALRLCELWYKYYFNEQFKIENVCFSVSELMKRLSSGTMREGDLLILEEAGVNIGSSDWQHKIVKMFNYVLQSFRSMNVGIIMTLPVLTMLAKQARQLLHFHLITQKINFTTNRSKSKCLFHQLNQLSGKSYWKYLRIKRFGKTTTVERSNFNLPSDELRQDYELKKIKFVTDLTEDFSKELDKIEYDKVKKMYRADLSKRQTQVYELSQLGFNQTQIAKKLGICQPFVHDIFQIIQKKGYRVYFEPNYSKKVTL